MSPLAPDKLPASTASRIPVPTAPGAHMTEQRRFPPPGLQRPATGTRTKSESAHRLLSAARRYAETEAVRAIAAVFAVAAVAVLAALAWLWVFRK